MWSLPVLITAGFATINNFARSVMEDISILQTTLAQPVAQGTSNFTYLRAIQAIIQSSHVCCNALHNFILPKTAKAISASNAAATA